MAGALVKRGYSFTSGGLCSPSDGHLRRRIIHCFCKGGWKPPLPAGQPDTNNEQQGGATSEGPSQPPAHLLRAALSLSVEPAFPGLRHQHGDQLPLGERQQGAVGSSRLVGHPRPHGSSYAAGCLARSTRNASLWGRSWRGNPQLC